MKSSDLFGAIQDVNRMQVGAIRSGIEVERKHWLGHLDTIFGAYRQSLGDPKANIPTALHSAIATAQRVVGELRQQEKQAAENSYAEAMIRKDQRERLEGTTEHDVDFVGRILKAGH